MKRFALFAALGLCAVAPGASAWAQNTPDGNIENGKRGYIAVGCFTCHGRAGQGGAYGDRPARNAGRGVSGFPA